jgi:hypothetical protein
MIPINILFTQITELERVANILSTNTTLLLASAFLVRRWRLETSSSYPQIL